MQQYSSPLRYPGGKSNLTRYLAKIIEQNHLSECIYVEPYAGGAGAALSLLFQEHVDKIIINDADYNIYCFWDSVLTKTDEFIDLVIKADVNIDVWNIQKEKIVNNKNFSMFEIGFATFYLNRCNRSGILGAGPIGGREQDGEWKIDARFNKADLIERIKRISYYKERIELYNLDAIDLINKINESFVGENILFFLDPPYYRDIVACIYLTFSSFEMKL